MAPGLDFFKSSQSTDAPVVQISADAEPETNRPSESPSPELTPRPDVYYNARLDPKNFLEGELSLDAATRLRQMLARPGIVVSLNLFYPFQPFPRSLVDCSWYL